jgi:hypothetical protein
MVFPIQFYYCILGGKALSLLSLGHKPRKDFFKTGLNLKKNPKINRKTHAQSQVSYKNHSLVFFLQISRAHISIQPNLKKFDKKIITSEKKLEFDNEGQESSRRSFLYFLNFG